MEMQDAADGAWRSKRGMYVLETVSDVMWETDARLLVTYVSSRDREQRGYGPEEVIGKHWFSYLTSASEQYAMKEIADYGRLAQQGRRDPLVLPDIQQVCKDGRVIWTDITMTAVVENGVLAGFVGVTRDRTDLKQQKAHLQEFHERLDRMQQQMERLTATDKLTGLYTRDKMSEIWNQEVVRVKRYKISLALVIANLDFFREINTTHGHVKGDEVLVEVSKIMTRFVRDSDSVFRWGNDEFVLLLPHTSREQARTQAERLRQAIEQHHFALGEKITISAGVTEYTEGDTQETAVIRADKAMYIAKRSGHNQVEAR